MAIVKKNKPSIVSLKVYVITLHYTSQFSQFSEVLNTLNYYFFSRVHLSSVFFLLAYLKLLSHLLFRSYLSSFTSHSSHI